MCHGAVCGLAGQASKVTGRKKTCPSAHILMLLTTKKGGLLSDQFSHEETKYLERGFTRRITDKCTLGQYFLWH